MRPLAMWLAMTGVMMTPVVLPWLRVLHRSAPTSAHTLTTPAFAAGYMAAWGGFSVLAAFAQSRLAAAGPSIPLLSSATAAGALALILIGGYQFTRWKSRCLRHCRSPAGFFINHWRPGLRGALEMGFGHGLLCLGCCWALMLSAFVVGMSDLRWMALLTAVMVAETAHPWGVRIVRPAGVLLVLGGLGVLLP